MVAGETYAVARTSTIFNESSVLQLVNSTATTVQLYATDEHAILLGVRTAGMQVSPLPSDPGHVSDPLVGDPTIADSILDRLVHNAHRLELEGESMRKNRGAKAGKQSA